MKRLAMPLIAAFVLLGSSIGGSWAAAPLASKHKPITGCTAHGKVSFMYWGDKGAAQEEHKAVLLAERKCPGLQVQEIYDSGNYDNDIATKIGSGNAPDVFMLDTKRIKQYVDKGALVNVDSYIKKDKLNLSKIYFKNCLPLVKYKGHVWGLLRDCASQGMLFYNKDMFDARHVKYPTDNWTYKDFLSAAEKLSGSYATASDPTTKLRFGYAFENSDVRMSQFLWEFGGSILTSNLQSCALTTKQSQTALQWMVDTRYKYHAAPTAEQANAAGGTVPGFRAQYYAMAFAGPFALNYMVKPSAYTGITSVPFKWGAVMTPIGPKNRAAPLTAASFVISQRSAHKTSAWWLARFLSQGVALALAGEYGTAIPADKSVASNAQVKKEYGSLLPKFFKLAQYDRPLQYISNYDQMLDVLNRDLAGMWANTESVSSATAKTCADINALPKS